MSEHNEDYFIEKIIEALEPPESKGDASPAEEPDPSAVIADVIHSTSDFEELKIVLGLLIEREIIKVSRKGIQNLYLSSDSETVRK